MTDSVLKGARRADREGGACAAAGARDSRGQGRAAWSAQSPATCVPGKPTAFEYDPLNRLLSIVDALGGATAFGYDPNGNLLTVTDTRGNTITHEYDAMDRLARRIDQLGAPETFTYDGLGNLVSTIDRKGQTTTFTYDAVNRRVRSAFADGAVTTLTYDSGGRLTQTDDTADPHRPIVMEYDALDRLFAETTSLGTLNYAYDALGRRTRMTVSGQAPVAYTYDAASRLRTITQAPLNPVDIQYDALGRRTLLTLPNAVSTEYQYDAASRLTALIYRNAAGLLGDLVYQYDRAGNRVAVGGSFARTLLPDPVPSATYDAANRQLTFAPRAMTFDANGNLTSRIDPSGTTTYLWDARDRLVSATFGATATSFAYDALLRRARLTHLGLPTDFRYDLTEVVEEGEPRAPRFFLRSLETDEVLVAGGQGILSDILRSPTLAVGADGTIARSYAFEPFGRLDAQPAPAPSCPAFTGREQDPTGLLFLRARYYDPVAARFVSEDPIGIAGGGNLYAYALNNPTGLTDPSGLHPLACTMAPNYDKSQRPWKLTPTELSRCASESLQDCLVMAESGSNPNAVSPRGARGRWQVMPQTRDALTRHGLLPKGTAFGPETFDLIGETYLNLLLSRCNSVRDAVAAYNAGPAAVNQARGVPSNPETLQYVEKINDCLLGKGFKQGLESNGITTRCCK